MRLANVGALTLGSLTGTWYRAVPPQFWTNPLNTAHTATIPSRFGAGSTTHRGFEALYLAQDQLVALFEINALLGTFHGANVPNPLSVTTVVPLRVRLNHVADLTRMSQRKLIGTNVQELTGDWRGYRLRVPAQPTTPPHTDVPTQKLGHALHALPMLEGFITYSAKVPTHKNLVLFPRKLGKGSSVVYTNPLTKSRVKIP